jgi:hypothetical protein
MKTAPAASLEVPQAEFPLELLIFALSAPAQFCKSHEFLDRHVSRQRAEEVFGRIELFAGPLDEQPLFLGGLRSLVPRWSQITGLRGRRSARVALPHVLTTLGIGTAYKRVLIQRHLRQNIRRAEEVRPRTDEIQAEQRHTHLRSQVGRRSQEVREYPTGR